MKKTISFKKNIEFKTMIGEITAINLEHSLKFIDESNVVGNLEVSGRYKMTEASIAEDEFKQEIPVEIMLTEKLDLNTAKVDIDDFYYEIENDDTLVAYIDVKIEGVELLEESKELDREIKEEKIEKKARKTKTKKEDIKEDIEEKEEEKERCIEEEELPPTKEIKKEEIQKEQEVKEVKEVKQEREEHEETKSLFSNFKDTDDTFKTYSVYIIRQEETIETIINKYQTTKEELEKYNDLNNLTIGTKIIIPSN